MANFNLINLDYLELVSGGDNGFKSEIFASFLLHFPAMLDAVQTTFEANHSSNFWHAVHKAKSPIKFLGMNSLGDKLDALEEDCRSSGTIPVYASQLIEELKQDATIALQEVLAAKANLVQT